MGTTPIFGKLALRSGLDPYTLAALRTSGAAILLWIVYGLFFRRYIFIFPAGLLGTMAVGAVNGLGSLLFYNGLLLLDDASLAQLLNMLYVLFVMLLAHIYGSHISRLSLVRAALAMLAAYLLTAFATSRSGDVHWLGVGLMIGGAFMYAYHVVLSQRGMYEMPAPTMALYALTWMAVTVVLARLFLGRYISTAWVPRITMGWWYVAGLAVVTALSRITLFIGVRKLGATAALLLNVAELVVTLLIAFVWLHEVLSLMQWIGAILLLVSVFLARWDTPTLDTTYTPLASRTLADLLRDDPITPTRFSTVSRIFRRKPQDELLDKLSDSGQ
jgi:drug/metabolite transporter (DMT)-like permease